jgi:hypothetical protein
VSEGLFVIKFYLVGVPLTAASAAINVELAAGKLSPGLK